MTLTPLRDFLAWLLSDRCRAALPFLRLALAMGLTYAIFAGFYGNDPHGHDRVIREVFLWPACLLLLALYIEGWRALKALPGQSPVLVAVAMGLVALCAGLILPFHSTDVFGYINRGWQQVAYGLNPYVFVIDDIPGWQGDAMITNHWVNNPSPYGFLFMHITRLYCWLGGGSLAGTVWAVKALNLLAHGAIGGMVYFGAKRLGQSRPDVALYLCLANPLMLLHQVANGHNDILMALFVTLGVYCAIAGAWRWVLPALTAGVLVKYAAVVALPFAAVWVWRRGGAAALGVGLGLSLLLVALAGAPYLADWSQFRLGEIGANATLSHNSLHSVFFGFYKQLAQLFPAIAPARETVKAVLKGLITGGFLLYFAWLSWGTLRDKALEPGAMTARLLRVQLLLLAVASAKFYPWYLGMVFPLALLLAEGHWLRRLMLVLCGAQMLAFTVLGQAHFLNYLLLTALPFAWTALERRGLPAAVRRFAPRPAFMVQ